MRDGIEHIEARFNCLKHKLEIDYLQACIQSPNDAESFKQEFEKQLTDLQTDLVFVRTSNKGGEFMNDESK